MVFLFFLPLVLLLTQSVSAIRRDACTIGLPPGFAEGIAGHCNYKKAVASPPPPLGGIRKALSQPSLARSLPAWGVVLS